MNFLSLEYFVLIAREGSIKRVAERIFVSPQSLSEHLKKLEQELGVCLLRRTRPHSLTPEGERLYEGAREILAGRDRMLADIKAMSEGGWGVTLGVAPMGTPPFLSELVSAFNAKYPQIVLNVVSWDPKAAPADQEDIDLFFLVPPLADGMEHVVLREDFPVAAVSRRILERVYGEAAEKLIGEMRAQGDITLLKALPFIDSSGFSETREEILGLRQAGLKTAPGLRISHFELALAMCMEGKGVLVTLEDVMRKHMDRRGRAEDILLFRLKGLGRHSLAVSFRKGKKLRPAEQALIREAKLLLGEEADNGSA